MRGGYTHELLDSALVDSLVERLLRREFDVVWLAVPCNSFTLLWYEGRHRPPRTREQPAGRRGLADWLQRYVERHNRLVTISVRIARAAFDAGLTFVIENIPDSGMRGSPHFRWRLRDHCPLWLMREVRELAQSTSPRWATGALCRCGSEFQKYLTLMAAGPRADRLLPFNRLVCNHTSHARRAIGLAPDGTPNSAAAGVYPPILCAWALAALFTDRLDGVPVEVAVASEGMRAWAAAARTQNESNLAAASAFIAAEQAATSGAVSPPPSPPSPEPDHDSVDGSGGSLEGEAGPLAQAYSAAVAAVRSKPDISDCRTLLRALAVAAGTERPEQATLRALLAVLDYKVRPDAFGTLQAANAMHGAAGRTARSWVARLDAALPSPRRSGFPAAAPLSSSTARQAARSDRHRPPSHIPGSLQAILDRHDFRDAVQAEHLRQPVTRRWRAAPESMPAHWPERADVRGAGAEAARQEALRYVSRRRAESESAEVLAWEPMPQPHPDPEMAAQPLPLPTAWPEGAPARPISIHQLYLPGVYDEIRSTLVQHAQDVEAGFAKLDVGQSASLPKRGTRIWGPEHQPAWASQCVWDTSDPADCVPLQPFTRDDLPSDRTNRDFFRRWGFTTADADMLQQICETGVASRATPARATVIMCHHGGLRGNLGVARGVIDTDIKAGWVSEPRYDLWTVPARLIARNVVVQHRWSFDEEGALYEKLKYRVTTDDSIDAEVGSAFAGSRNNAIDRGGWADVPLTSVRTLARAVAIVKAVSTAMGLHVVQAGLERVALWALDLSHAFRELSICRLEWWLQQYVYAGGACLDRRCEFGTAHMVDFFQRVSTFVLKVAMRRVAAYDRTHPYSAARQAWMAQRAAAGAREDTPAFGHVYLDDASGMSVLGEGEPLRGTAGIAPSRVNASLDVDPALPGRAGEPPRVRLRLFVAKSRAEIHLAIVCGTYEEAGWSIAQPKIQLGFTIDQLGLAITSEGDGCLFMQEAKRRGLETEIGDQLRASFTVARTLVEKLTGRLSHASMVVAEGNAYLQPLYRFMNARWTITAARESPEQKRRLVKPPFLTIRGGSHTQREYVRALQWWLSVVRSDVSVPLAPRLVFPAVGEDGCAYMFTDAAREAGTGFGAHSIIRWVDHEARWIDALPPVFFTMSVVWEVPIQRALQADVISMPAGECYGAVVFADALLRRLGDVTHLVVYTDSDATARGLTTGSSGAPQLNLLLSWLMEQHPAVQFLGVHQPGVRNIAADRSSRSAGGHEVVLQEARDSGSVVETLGPAQGAHVLLDTLLRTPLRA